MNTIQKSTVINLDLSLNQHKPLIRRLTFDNPTSTKVDETIQVNFQQKNEQADEELLTGMLIW